MLLVATTDRLVILRATRRWRPTTVLGTVRRADIAQVTFPYLGGVRWKVLRIERVDRSVAQAWADTSTAAEFLAASPPG